MISWRPVALVIGLLIAALGLAMLLPALVDAAKGNPDWQVFALSSAATGFAGGALCLSMRVDRVELGLRETFLLTVLSWLATSAFAALPFLFAHLRLDLADAFFEAVSGLTTTGSTVLVGLDNMPPGILLWRALLQWMGGLGIIAMAMAIMPFLGVGGMQLFRTESSDISEKVLPRPGQIARAIASVYVVLTALCAIAYWAVGMTPFEAVTHAMTTLSTGGYSTSDASMAHFGGPLLEVLAILFMVLGSLPFVIYVRLLGVQWATFWYDSQVRAFVRLLLAATLILTLWLCVAQERSPLEALLLAAFNVTSIVTTTGYATTDYATWGGFAAVFFFLLSFVGGCTGSTAGAIKLFRFQVLALFVKQQMKLLATPHGVFPQRYNWRSLPSEVSSSVVGFFFVYIASIVLLALALAGTGLDLITSISGAVTAIGNVGPGLGPIIGPAGNFSSLSDSAKWLLSLGMLLGRLELFTVLLLFLPRFWRW